MLSLELEKTYLAKKLPPGLEACPHREVLDTYFPLDETHPVLRVRRKSGPQGETYEMTKKEPAKDGDASEQNEHTITLAKGEYEAFAATPGKRVRKIRYDYDHHGHNAEVSLFKDGLEGLVMVDVEFGNAEDKDAFAMPDFCLADVTQEDAFAGGMLCGKTYADIERKLKEFGYEKLKQD